MANRAKVLSIFKTLHRTREKVFTGDDRALKVTREKINEEFRKHVKVANPEEINNLLKIATESNEMLLKQVVQAVQVRPNVYRIRSDHLQAKCTGIRDSCGPQCTCVT